MSKFTKQINKTYEFDGDKVTITMKRLKRKDAIKLAPYMVEPDKDGKVSMKFEDSLLFVDKACEVLSTHVTTMTGLFDSDSEVITKEEVFGDGTETYFMSLISEVIGDLMEASFTGFDEKKSGKPQQDTSTESVKETN